MILKSKIVPISVALSDTLNTSTGFSFVQIIATSEIIWVHNLISETLGTRYVLEIGILFKFPDGSRENYRLGA